MSPAPASGRDALLRRDSGSERERRLWPRCTRTRPTAPAAWLAGVLCMAALRAAAQGGLLLVDPPPERTPHFSYGASLFAFPAYPGSARTTALAIPAFEWTHPGGAFVSTDLGIGWNFSRRPDLQWGVRLWPELARRPADGERLRRLAGIPLRLERSMFANWSPVSYAQLQSALRTGLGPDAHGLLAEAGVSMGAPLAPGVLVGLTLGMSWGNAAYRQGFFGIDPQAAAAAGLAPYQLGAGWQDFQTAIGGEWQISPVWRLDAKLENWRLLGGAAASPLTESRWQHGLFLGLWRDLGP